MKRFGQTNLVRINSTFINFMIKSRLYKKGAVVKWRKLLQSTQVVLH